MAGCDRGRRMSDSLCGGPKTPRGLPKPATDQFTGLHLARAIATAVEPFIQTFPGSAARGSGALQLWTTWPRERGPKTAARGHQRHRPFWYAHPLKLALASLLGAAGRIKPREHDQPKSVGGMALTSLETPAALPCGILRTLRYLGPHNARQ
jgi:hypothetical protein